MTSECVSPILRLKSRAPHPIPDGEASPRMATGMALLHRQEPQSAVVGQGGDVTQSRFANEAEPSSGVDVARSQVVSVRKLPAAPEPNSVGPAIERMLPNGALRGSTEPLVTGVEARSGLSPIFELPSAHGHTIGVIREMHRQRNDLIKTEGDLTRRIRAICRRAVEYDPFASMKEKTAKMAAANAMYKRIQGLGGQSSADALNDTAADAPEPFESGEGLSPDDAQSNIADLALIPSGEGDVHANDDAHFEIAIPFAAPCIAESERMIRKQRMVVERMMTKYAKTLPIFETFVEPLPGFGALGFAQIIGEAGDIGMYSNPAKLWKRMGLGLVDGERQRKHTDAAKAAAAGYNPRRRSTMFVIGDSMIKKQGPMRDLYLARKVVEVQKAEAEGLTVLPAAKIKDATKHRSEMHVHRRAQRYMEKRLLRDLWRAWHDETPQEKA